MKKYNNEKVSLITGSGSGIGRAIAIELAKHGHAIAVNDINSQAGHKVLDEIKTFGGQGCFIKADVGDSKQVKEMFSRIKSKWARLDVLVNNAGVPGDFSLLEDMSDEIWHKTIGVHLNGTFYCLREAARIMIPAKYGRIINMASIAGLVGTIGSGEYSAAKAGVINLTKTSAKELATYGITSNAIAPGIVATPINRALELKNSRFIKAVIESTPTGNMTTPEQIAQLVLFLISPAANNMTGQLIPIDGAASTTMAMDNFMHRMIMEKQSLKDKKY